MKQTGGEHRGGLGPLRIVWGNREQEIVERVGGKEEQRYNHQN